MCSDGEPRVKGDNEMAKRSWEEALVQSRKAGDPYRAAIYLMALAGLAWEEGNIPYASQKLSEVSVADQASTNPNLAPNYYVQKSKLARESGDEAGAANFVTEALKSARKQNPEFIGRILFEFALLNVQQPPEQRAAVWLGREKFWKDGSRNDVATLGTSLVGGGSS